MKNLFDLTGKVAVVTGSSKGIGKSIASQMAFHGSNVVISSRNQDSCDAVASEINGSLPKGGGSALGIACHVSKRNDLENLVNTTKERLGNIDILVCNAAVNPFYGSMLEISDTAYEKVLDSNVKSNHWLSQLVIPDMIEQKDGVIIIVSSVGGLRGSATLGTYGVSKAADIAIVRNISAEFGSHNIRANAIAPGLIRTDFAKALWENPETLKNSTQNSHLKRIGEPDEIGGAAVFLASDAGKFVSGQTIVIDGGS